MNVQSPFVINPSIVGRGRGIALCFGSLPTALYSLLPAAVLPAGASVVREFLASAAAAAHILQSLDPLVLVLLATPIATVPHILVSFVGVSSGSPPFVLDERYSQTLSHVGIVPFQKFLFLQSAFPCPAAASCPSDHSSARLPHLPTAPFASPRFSGEAG